MKQYHLDGKKMTDREHMHDQLSDVFHFPEYYGRNLDALYDLLSQETEPRQIILNNPADIAEELYESLMVLFLDLTKECTNYQFVLEADAAKPQRKYLHYKGNEYKVLSLSLHSETLEVYVNYEALYGSQLMWVRPLRLWQKPVNKDGQQVSRFTLIEE